VQGERFGIKRLNEVITEEAEVGKTLKITRMKND
jgi:hypothetical protein